MNDLVVEAQSDKEAEQEPAPGVEGLVYDAHRSFSFDCHYEQGLMRFKKDELAIFDPDGSLKDDAMISFAIRTPFCDKIVSYTKAELEQLKDNGYVPSGDKKADTDWLRFYIHPSTSEQQWKRGYAIFLRYGCGSAFVGRVSLQTDD